MRKTRLSILTALILVVVCVGIFLARHYLLGADIDGPRGRSSWQIVLEASGVLHSDDARIVLSLPPDFREQHIFDEHFRSTELSHRPAKKSGTSRREVVWKSSGMEGRQPFQ